MTCYDKLNNLHRNRKSYYYDKYNNMVNPFANPDNSYEFIKQYFKAGKKEEAFRFQDKSVFKQNGKHVHTVVMYFIGVLLREYIESINYQMLNENIDDFTEWHYNFTYTWFLTCLYHDTGSAYERRLKNERLNGVESQENFYKIMLESYNIKYSPYKDSKIMSGIQTYNNDIVNNYFYYRFDNRKVIDHGILGGYLLFDRLSKNYWKAHKKYNANNVIEADTVNNFELKGRAWRINHIDHFAYVCDAILAHNIWTSDNNTLYEKYNLSILLNKNFTKLSMKRNPLVYFLGLIDTIEPTKCFDTENSEIVLKGIDIDFNVKDKLLVLKVHDERLDYDKWFSKIEGLNQWLEISSERRDNEKLLILSLN